MKSVHEYLQARTGAATRTRAAAARSPRPAPVYTPGTITVPVWFHVINNGDGLANGDVTQKMIDDQIAVLNAAYAGETGGYVTPFAFNLAGVTRTTNAAWYTMGYGSQAEKDAKAFLRQGGAGTLNLYSANSATASSAGPRSRTPTPATRATTAWCSSTRRSGGGAAPYDLGDTATHEIGHWLGLYHTFQGGCNKGDYVSDTGRRGRGLWLPGGTRHLPRRGRRPDLQLHGLHRRRLHVRVHGVPGRPHGPVVRLLPPVAASASRLTKRASRSALRPRVAVGYGYAVCRRRTMST